MEYLTPLTLFIGGDDAIRRARPVIAALHSTRLMVIHGPHLARTRFLQLVLDSLGSRVAEVYSQIPPHPTIDVVARCVEIARSRCIDGLASVGGGSAADAAKGVKFVLAEPWRLSDGGLARGGAEETASDSPLAVSPPLIAYPTTCSGAEMTPGFTIRVPEGRKAQFWRLGLAARLVVGPPEGLLETPLQTVLGTGMNGLAHCIEGLYSRRRTPISDALALQGIRMFVHSLPRLGRDSGDRIVLSDLRTAAVIGGMVITNAWVGIHHAICHCLGGRLNLPHGLTNAVVLPAAMRFNLQSARDALAVAATAMGLASGDPRTAAERGIRRVEELQEELGLPRRLRDLGVDRGALRAVAEDAIRERGARINPREITHADEVLTILEEVW